MWTRNEIRNLGEGRGKGERGKGRGGRRPADDGTEEREEKSGADREHGTVDVDVGSKRKATRDGNDRDDPKTWK
jgi:hypothetical protein